MSEQPPPPPIEIELDHVLVVRPPDLIREVLVDDLQEDGRTVSTADDCLAAGRVLTVRVPAVVLVDMLLRDPHPRTLVASASMHARVPTFIGLGPFGHAGALADSVELGAFCCLRLPITAGELLHAVELARRKAVDGSGT